MEGEESSQIHGKPGIGVSHRLSAKAQRNFSWLFTRRFRLRKFPVPPFSPKDSEKMGTHSLSISIHAVVSHNGMFSSRNISRPPRKQSRCCAKCLLAQQ